MCVPCCPERCPTRGELYHPKLGQRDEQRRDDSRMGPADLRQYQTLQFATINDQSLHVRKAIWRRGTELAQPDVLQCQFFEARDICLAQIPQVVRKLQRGYAGGVETQSKTLLISFVLRSFGFFVGLLHGISEKACRLEESGDLCCARLFVHICCGIWKTRELW